MLNQQNEVMDDTVSSINTENYPLLESNRKSKVDVDLHMHHSSSSFIHAIKTSLPSVPNLLHHHHLHKPEDEKRRHFLSRESISDRKKQRRKESNDLLTFIESSSHLPHSDPNYRDLSVDLSQKALPWLHQSGLYIKEKWNQGFLQALLAWVLWILVGTIFYAQVNFNGNFFKGFYYSVNVGYSIGWGVFHDNSNICKVFSIFYLLVGAVFVSRWLAYLLELAISEHDSSYEQYVIRTNMLADNVCLQSRYFKWFSPYYVWMAMNSDKLFVIYIWLLYVTFGAVWSYIAVKWPFIDAMYFSVSSMSTGGLWGIPHDSPEYFFLLVGLFALTGVPLMGMAMANIASIFLDARNYERVHKLYAIKLDDREVELFHLLNHHSKAYIDKNEYLLLNLVKKKKVDINLIQEIWKEFDAFDTKATGILVYEDIAKKVGNSQKLQTLPPHI